MNASEIRDQVPLLLKLVVHKETNKMLFAEAGKHFMDVLISFLTLPLGTIARLVAKECDMGPLKIGSLSSLYESVANIGDEYMMTDSCKEMLLQPRNPMEDYYRSLKINVDDTEPTKYYVCNDWSCSPNALRVMCSTFKNKKCSCGKFLDKQIRIVHPRSLTAFVDNVFMVTDDLCLMPMPLDTSTSFIKKIFIESISYLEEIVVNVNENQLIDLLKCSLISKTPLTDVFLHKKLSLQKSYGDMVFPSDFSEEQYTPVKVSIIYRKFDGKVICAQGKEDFANFLLSILTFPLGAVVRLLKGNFCMGSFDGLYKSVVDLSEDHFNPKGLKGKLVDLGLAPQFKLSNQVLPISELKFPKYYCNLKNGEFRHGYFLPTELYLDTFPYFSSIGPNPVEMVDPISEDESAKGFVKGPSFYVVTDDLVVSPMHQTNSHHCI